MTMRFGGPDSEAPPRRPGRVRLVVTVLLVWVLLWVWLSAGDGEVRQPALLAAVVVGAAAVVWGARGLAPFTAATDWTPGYISRSAPAGRDPRFSRLSR